MSQTVEIGAYVLYGKMGVCLVQEQKAIAMGKETAEYYVLCPVSDGRSSVFVPCDNETLVAKMSPLMTKEEIDALLSIADAEKLEWIDDRTARIAYYRMVMNSGDRRMPDSLDLLPVPQKARARSAGKAVVRMDEATLQECMRLIDEEFSMVLGIPHSQVVDYILARL